MARNLPDNHLLQKLLLGVNLGAAGGPFPPDESWCPTATSFVTGATGRVAHVLAMLASGLAGTGQAVVHSFAAPADCLDFLLFADKPADLAAFRRAAAMLAAAISVAGNCQTRHNQESGERRNDQSPGERSHSSIPFENSVAGGATAGEARNYQLKSNRMARISDFVFPNVVSAVVMGWIQSNKTRTRSLQYQLIPVVKSW